MEKFLYIAAIAFLMVQIGHGQSGMISEPYAQTQGDVSDTVFVSGMGCSDPNCTDASHYHDCPIDCGDYEHHHHCGLDCIEVSHHHRGMSGVYESGQHHVEEHHGGYHHGR